MYIHEIDIIGGEETYKRDTRGIRMEEWWLKFQS